jgi:hypothetical protein
MPKKNQISGILAFSVLFSFVFLAVPEYGGWEDLDPDDCLDLFVIPQKSAASKAIGKECLSDCFSSVFCPKVHLTQNQPLWVNCSDSFIPKLILSVALRC